MSQQNPQYLRTSSSSQINADGVFVATYTLGIIYSAIARGTTVLAHYACCHGNFSEVAQQVLRTISTEEDSMMTYASGDYMYHYICEGGIIFLCITDDEFERSKAFLFLNVIKERFQDAYADSTQSALPFAMNSEFAEELAKQMKRHTEETSLNLLPAENGIRLDNIGMRDLDLVEDGQLEQLELLRSDSVSVRSIEALISPQNREKFSQCLKSNWKTITIISVVVLIVIVLIVSVYVGVCFQNSKNTCS